MIKVHTPRSVILSSIHSIPIQKNREDNSRVWKVLLYCKMTSVTMVAASTCYIELTPILGPLMKYM